MICDGELLVSKSADAACDAARALKAKGITGSLVMCDGKTGKPRYAVNIEKAAGMTVEEGPIAPRFRRYRARGGSEARSAEMASDGLADQEAGEAA